jgi:glycosyltransferase involved in cell wall biosynthesis
MSVIVTSKDTCRIGFAMEWALGHVTHARNLEDALQNHPEILPTWMRVEPSQTDVWRHIPGYATRMSLRARQIIHQTGQAKDLDLFFCHTQSISLFAHRFINHVPTVISLDGTPKNFDELSLSYGVATKSGMAEKLKTHYYGRIFRQAVHCVTWSAWAKQSLVEDYAIPADRITVIRPGISLNNWQAGKFDRQVQGKVKLLFVGGDFARKGGYVLLEAFKQGLSDICALDIVTQDQGVQSDGAIRVHHGLTPNSDELKRLYQDADIFVLPSLGDTTGIAFMEAAASSLPVVATHVGAIGEIVIAETGCLIPPNSVSDLILAIRSLAEDPDRRAKMAAAARRRAESLFDIEANCAQLIELLKMQIKTK